MTPSQLSDVVEHLDRKAGFMLGQAKEIDAMSGTPEELADNKDRANRLRERSATFKQAGQLLMREVYHAQSPAAPGRTADHGGAVDLNTGSSVSGPATGTE